MLIRAGHTEAGCDLAHLAGAEPAAVICEILEGRRHHGPPARISSNSPPGNKLKIGAIRDLIVPRRHRQPGQERVSEKHVHTEYGHFTLTAFEDKTTGDVLWRCTAGSIMSMSRPSCGFSSRSRCSTTRSQERPSHLPGGRGARTIAEAGSGAVIFAVPAAEQPRPAGGLTNDPSAPKPAVKWDPRLFGIGAQMLRDLNVGKMTLLASPADPSMAGFGLGDLRLPASRRRPALESRQQAARGAGMKRRTTTMARFRQHPRDRTKLAGAGQCIGICMSRFNQDGRVRRAVVSLHGRAAEAQRAPDDMLITTVPGALDSAGAAEDGRLALLDALIALGAVIRGETYHLSWSPTNRAASPASPWTPASRSPTACRTTEDDDQCPGPHA